MDTKVDQLNEELHDNIVAIEQPLVFLKANRVLEAEMALSNYEDPEDSRDNLSEEDRLLRLAESRGNI